MGLFIPFEACSPLSGADVVSHSDHPTSGSVGADTPRLHGRADTSPGFDVCPVRGHCEVGIHLASLLGVFDVKER
jgi:hypothetical protein